MLLVFFFGKKKEWEFEAKLMHENSRDIVAEIEFKKYKNNESIGEIKFYNKSLREIHEVEVLINKKLISKLTLSIEDRSAAINFPQIKKKGEYIKEYSLMKQKIKWNVLPLFFDQDLKIENKDEVEVYINNRAIIFKGVFFQD